jgi:hypothetical protein
MGEKSDLSPECQKFVKKLFAFFSNEKATKKPIVSKILQVRYQTYGWLFYKVHLLPPDKLKIEPSNIFLLNHIHCRQRTPIENAWSTSGYFKAVFLEKTRIIIVIIYSVCLTLQCTVLWMVRGIVCQIRPNERAKMFDDFDHCVIKRTNHGLYSRKLLRPSQ